MKKLSEKISCFLFKKLSKSSFGRNLYGLAVSLFKKNNRVFPFFLGFYEEENCIGPIQRSEALLLHAIVKVVNPKTIVEFGFCKGHSAFNFLEAMAQDAKLFSFDIGKASKMHSEKFFPRDDRFHFVFKSQDQFSSKDIGNRSVDIVFFDASHNIKLNQKTFLNILPYLSESSLIIIHDTGLWNKRFFQPIHHSFVKACLASQWVDDEHFAHQPDERLFVNWIISTFPEFRAIFFDSDTCLRHGLTILQKGGLLR
jgi:hypothetical protein